MREPSAQIICRREPYGDICRWEGDARAIAHVSREAFIDGDGYPLRTLTTGSIHKIGTLKVRVITPVVVTGNAQMDCAAVMLESPHAQLYQLYREKAESIVRFVRRCEIAVLAFRLELREGQRLNFTVRVADWLL